MRNAGNAYSILSRDKNKHIRKEDFHGNPKPIYASMFPTCPTVGFSLYQQVQLKASPQIPTHDSKLNLGNAEWNTEQETQESQERLY